jgi:hemoglobin-like flavoprotein
VNFEQIFDDSYERIVGRKFENRNFFEAFYHRFLGMSDEISEKFRDTDMTHQQSVLKKSFYSLLTFYASGNADHYLEQIARSHSQSHLAVKPELYDLWLEALIDTAREFDTEFGERSELAWRLAMAPGIVYMKFHFDKRLD